MKRLPLYLTVASLVPFVCLSVTVSLKFFSDPRLMTEVLLTYSTVIISFLGGIHWGIAVHQYAGDRKTANMLILESVLPVMAAWGVLFYPDMHIKLLVLTLLYTFMWAVDSVLYSNDVIPQWFFNLRCVVTPVIIVSLYVAYFGLT